ncbi:MULTISPECIES: NifU family protein [Weeksella]|uniref:NifU family protein n=1 Tax=Weeksella TaxID=1013 RepID=UPI0008A227B6|nr:MULTISPECIES: NifU family protein [Weeksella]MDK7375468.1 NifU family protein [Weeksella virosa]OFM84525.1 hypothetical protein HMPREF2660_08420 [Weeksella sp. HMSC059D05]
MKTIYTENTPNPNILKFVCPTQLTAGGVEYKKDDSAENSPLAQVLLTFPFIDKVFITANFVALEKIDTIKWEDVSDDLIEIIQEHYDDDTIIYDSKKKVPFTLYAEMTPNPAVMKFVSNKLLVPSIIEIKSREKAQNVPIATAIFQEYPFIEEVFIAENYISLTKNDTESWDLWTMDVRSFVLNYLQTDGKIFNDDYEFVTEIPHEVAIKSIEEMTDVEQQIKAILDEYVQPAVANDGGNIELIEFDEQTKTAKMLLQGACSGCPSSTATLKHGIEGLLKQMLPEVVNNVEAING